MLISLTTNRTDQPELDGLAAPAGPGAWFRWVVAAIVAAATASGALARDRGWSAERVDDVRIIELELETDLLVYDFCWSHSLEDVRARFADEAASQMDDPAALYVIRIDGLPAQWEPIDKKRLRFTDHDEIERDVNEYRLARYGDDLTALRDCHGRLIPRERLRDGRRTYEDDVEEALIDVTNRIRSRRPAALLTFDGFHPTKPGKKGDYQRLAEVTSFTFCGADESDKDRIDADDPPRKIIKRLLDKKARKFLEREGGLALYCVDDHWYLASPEGDPIAQVTPPEGLDEAWETLIGREDDSESAGDDEEPDRWVDDDEGPAGPGNPNDPDQVASNGPSGPAPGADGGDGGNDPGDNQPGDGGGDEPPVEEDPDEVIVVLPDDTEEPYADQHGPQTRSSLMVFQPDYQKRTQPIVTISLASAGIARRNPQTNPRGWRPYYEPITTEGWDHLDPLMEELVDAGYRDIWFWHFSGYHRFNSSYAQELMPWLHLDAHTPAMLSSWSGFVQRWKARGVRFGVWIGGAVAPNFGTTQNPLHRPLTRDDFGFVGDTVKLAKDLGFDEVGFDVFTWILNRRDLPPGKNWRDRQGWGQRDQGIAWALVEYLDNRADIADMRITMESRLPHGRYLAQHPTLFVGESRNDQSGQRVTIDTLEPPVYADLVVPGHESTVLLIAGGWTLQEFQAMLAKLDQYGYRAAIAEHTLWDVGLLPPRHQIWR